LRQTICPPPSSLLWDAVRVMVRLLKQAAKLPYRTAYASASVTVLSIRATFPSSIVSRHA